MSLNQGKLQRQILFMLGIIVITIGMIYLVGLVSDMFRADPNAPAAPNVPGNNGPAFPPK